jgi:hypothetical protein
MLGIPPDQSAQAAQENKVAGTTSILEEFSG